MDICTLGEAMVAMVPQQVGYLRYVSDYEAKVAGAESNVAIGMSKLGHSATWLSKLGHDELSQIILQRVRGEGVDASQVIYHPEHPTGVLFKQIDAHRNTSVYYYRNHSAFSTFQQEELTEGMISAIQSARLVHLTGITVALGENCKEVVKKVIEVAKKAGCKLSFDPNIRLKLWSEEEARDSLLPLLPLFDIMLIGDEEGQILFGTKDPQEIIKKLRAMGVTTIAVKQGGDGAVVAQGDTIATIPAEKVSVVDTVGAGDAFASGFLSAVLEEKPIEECGRWGALMGAFAVSSYGDTEGLPDRIAFEQALSKEDSIFR